ncbi:MAG: hypothetical protein WKG07_37155 [Hymenobacter sp.]
MRLSVLELKGYFPGGKTTLVAAVADRFLTSFRQQAGATRLPKQ